MDSARPMQRRLLALVLALSALAALPASAPAAPQPAVRLAQPRLVNLPGAFPAGTATFGPALSTTPVEGEVAFYLDDVGSAVDGCEPEASFAGFPPVSGRIAIIYRGTCAFTQKVKNAQNAGAIGVIMVNTPNAPAFSMAGVDPSITIPAAGIAGNDGDSLVANYNVGQRRFALGVLDITPPPPPTVPSDITVHATSLDGAAVSFATSATDDTDPAPTVVCNHPSGSTFGLGTTVVACRATDAGGNRSLPSVFNVQVLAERGTYTARGSIAGPATFSAVVNCDAASSTKPFIVEWNPGTGTKRFTKTEVTFSTCVKEPAGYASPAGFNRMHGSAYGTITGPGFQGVGTIEWDFVDGGAGANAADRVAISVRDDTGAALVDAPAAQPGPFNGTPGGVWTLAP